ncbi:MULTISPECIES: amidohydrolase family protein [Paraburkholderia]|uniref:Amidohydrolase family protein n=1 Tax=Paraburkholderia podalyriae TaxID=1938811 RepID=A0ABR7PK49_9BURK|nr:amidohydrolase family protein [Paraburkholderia podalyriae]MBC8746748.1 amidohydrolase family protein [Paraburkholderia podalyriae]
MCSAASDPSTRTMLRMPDAIVDAHHHLWRLSSSGVQYPWLQDAYDPNRFMLGSYQALRNDFDVAAFRQVTQPAPVVASVHVEAECARSQALAETQWLHAVARDGLPSAIVAWVDLLASDASDRLAEQAAWPLVRGIRFKPVTTGGPGHQRAIGHGTLSDPGWSAALERLAVHGLSWDLRLPFWHLEEAAALVADSPGVTVILEHAGLPWDRTDEGLALWRRGMAALAENPNVFVKLSEFGLRNSAWDTAQNVRIIQEVLAIFGWRRCMFASNFPVASLRVTYSMLIQTFAEALAQLDESSARAVWHDNAMRVYRIDTP